MGKDNNYSNASDSEFLKNRARRSSTAQKKTSSKTVKVLKIIFIVLLSIALIVLGVYTYFRKIYKPDVINNNNSLISNTGVKTEHIDSVTGEKNVMNKDMYTFLATGCDKSGSLTDVIMLISYDMTNQKAAIMSIPRDTYVRISSKLILDNKGNISKDNFTGSGTYASKINGVYAHGRTLALNELDRLVKQSKGMNKAELNELCSDSFLGIDSETLTNYINETDYTKKNSVKEKIRKEFGIRYLAVLIYYNFGVPCDFYAQVNISGFRNIVDAIDGVDVYVPSRMYYKDPLQDLYIDIPAGNQHLNGKKAEEFVRFRSGYASADIGRIEAQKIFMTAFIKKLCSPQIVTKIGSIVEIISENLTTNISVSDAMFFATRAIEMDLSNIVMLTLPGSGEYVGGISYFLVDKEQTIETVNTYLNKYTKPLNEEQFCIEVVSNAGNQVSGALSVDNVTNNTVNLDFVSKPTPDSSTEDEEDSDVNSDESSEENSSKNPDENENDELISDDENTNNEENNDETSSNPTDNFENSQDENSNNDENDDILNTETSDTNENNDSYESILGQLSQEASQSNNDLSANETSGTEENIQENINNNSLIDSDTENNVADDITE